MPEGPEIRRAADRVQAAVAGRPLTEVFLGFDHLKRFEGELRRRTIERIDTRGKAMLTRFDNGLVLYSHNQLYGRWYVRARGSLPRTGRRLRVGLHTDQRSAYLYSATDVAVLEPGELASHPFLARLGPDVLAEDLTVRGVRQRLDDRPFRGRQLAALLLDQAFIAGLGNYLRSEILHAARLGPRRRPAELTMQERVRLARAILRISRRAYQTGGITNPPARVRRLKKRGVSRRRFRHAVYGRRGRPCYECDQPVERLDIAARAVYVCPGCQAPR